MSDSDEELLPSFGELFPFKAEDEAGLRAAREKKYNIKQETKRVIVDNRNRVRNRVTKEVGTLLSRIQQERREAPELTERESRIVDGLTDMVRQSQQETDPTRLRDRMRSASGILESQSRRVREGVSRLRRTQYDESIMEFYNEYLLSEETPQQVERMANFFRVTLETPPDDE